MEAQSPIKMASEFVCSINTNSVEGGSFEDRLINEVLNLN
jgi:hypothetical protein